MDKLSRFWYDKLGRVIYSQNSEQKTPVNSNNSNRYSYTLYNGQGRIIEVGGKAGVSLRIHLYRCRNKAMNDILSKSIHGDVFNAKGVKLGKVGFELENGVITPKSLGENLTNTDRKFIENVGNKQLQTAGFKRDLLNKVNETINSGQISPNTNRFIKLKEMQEILTPPIK